MPDRIENWGELGGFGLMLAALLGAGYKLMAWIFGWGVRLHDLEVWKRVTEDRLAAGQEKLDDLHTAVTQLVERVDALLARME